MDNAVREVMSILADTNAGTAPWADTMTIGDAADLTKKMRFELSAITAGQTRVVTMPDANVTIPSGTIVTTTATHDAHRQDANRRGAQRHPWRYHAIHCRGDDRGLFR